MRPLILVTLGMAIAQAIMISTAAAQLSPPSISQTSTSVEGLYIGPPNQVSGILLKIEKSTLTIRTRTGAVVLIDDTKAAQAKQVVVLVIGEPYTCKGTYDSMGKLQATTILQAKPSPEAWRDDH